MKYCNQPNCKDGSCEFHKENPVKASGRGGGSAGGEVLYVTPQQEIREDWDKYCKEDLDTRKSYADWFLSRFSAEMEKIAGEVEALKRGVSAVEPSRSQSFGFNAALDITLRIIRRRK